MNSQAYTALMEQSKALFIQQLRDESKLAADHVPMIHATKLRADVPLTGSPQESVIFQEINSAFADNNHFLAKKPEYFFPVLMAINLQKYDSTNPTGTAAVNHANFPLFTYVDLNYFNGPNEAIALNTVYQARLNLKSNSREIWREILTEGYEVVPPVQYDAATSTRPQYGPSLAAKGFYPLHQHFYIKGDDLNTATLDLGPGTKLEIDGSTNTEVVGTIAGARNEVVIMFYGFQWDGESYENTTGTCAVSLA